MTIIYDGIEYGVTDTGFVKMTDEVVKKQLQDAFKLIYTDPNLNDDSVIGQRISLMRKQIDLLWDLAEATYNTFNPSAASKAALDNLLAIADLTRVAASHTEVICTLGGTTSTIIAAGKQISNTAGDLFELQEEVAIGGGGTVDGVFLAIESGPIPAVAGTVSTIMTPVSGWNTVTNASDGTIGKGIETDAEARIRRADSLLSNGNSALDAIVAALLNDVDNVTLAKGFENTTDAIDANGTDPHEIQIVVAGGDDQEIADKIWEKKAGGVGTSGTNSETVVDSNGDDQTVKFTRPANKYVHLDITIDAYNTEEDFPAEGDDLIKQACMEYGAALELGQNLIIQKWNTPIFSIPGIAEITVLQAVTDTVGGTPSFVSTNIAIGATSMAHMDLANITVHL